ncbi:MAG: nitrilase-related carbon-nitrogen hydrolase [Candidatus Zixiibacteriota bacterium]
MKVALFQNSPVFGEIEKNVDSVLAAVKDREYDLLVLPELFATGYQFVSVDEARTLADIAGHGYTFQKMRELAAAKKALIVYGFPELDKGRLFNSSIAVKPDGDFHIYRKIHLFNTEKEIFEPGQDGFSVFDFDGAKIGMMICFDWRFPEAARRLALDGAQIICHPSNLVLPHCPDAMITRALENNVFTITCDRIGTENRIGQPLTFIGKSRIIGPDGRILGQLGSTGTGFLEAEIDPQDADNKQITPRNEIFSDRRPEFY